VNAVSTTYSYPTTSHRLASLSGGASRSFTYDGAGNLTASAGITYAYDGRGRMKQAGTTTYAVNGLGQRVKKNDGTDTFFVYDEAEHLIGEYDAAGAPIEETVWLGDLPVAVVKPNAASYDVFYVWTDNLGTPRLITDAANQARWEWPNADPFGNNLPDEDPAGLGAFTYNLRFPGQYYDAEKGSNYNYFRDYDPGIGRYVQSDPVGLLGGKNSFSYVFNTPLGLMDSRGLAPDCVPIWVGPSVDAGQFRDREQTFRWAGGYEFRLNGARGSPEIEGEPNGEICLSVRMQLTIYHVFYLFDEFDLYARRQHTTTFKCTDTLECGKTTVRFHTLIVKEAPLFLKHVSIRGQKERDPIKVLDVSLGSPACLPGFDRRGGRDE
jgi:RHS repeat-associated protein